MARKPANPVRAGRVTRTCKVTDVTLTAMVSKSNYLKSMADKGTPIPEAVASVLPPYMADVKTITIPGMYANLAQLTEALQYRGHSVAGIQAWEGREELRAMSGEKYFDNSEPVDDIPEYDAEAQED